MTSDRAWTAPFKRPQLQRRNAAHLPTVEANRQSLVIGVAVNLDDRRRHLLEGDYERHRCGRQPCRPGGQHVDRDVRLQVRQPLVAPCLAHSAVDLGQPDLKVRFAKRPQRSE